MPDREKVINQFENYLSRVGAYRKDCSKGCDACMPLHNADDYCDIQLLDDVLALLKEQRLTGHWEKAEDEGCVIYSNAYVQCSICKQKAYMGKKDAYCRNCGAKMEGAVSEWTERRLSKI